MKLREELKEFKQNEKRKRLIKLVNKNREFAKTTQGVY